jgi:hypothetical protein
VPENPRPAPRWPEYAGTAAKSPPLSSVRDRCRRGAGWPHGARPDPGAEPAQLTMDAAIPQIGFSLASRSTNARSLVARAGRPRRRGRSSGAGPGRDATAAMFRAGRAARASPTVAAAAPARPAPPSRPIHPGVGSPAGAAPRPRGAIPVAPRSWSPNAAPAVPAAGRRSGRGVAAPSTDHRRRSRPRRSRSSAPTTDFLAPTGNRR